MSAVQPLAVRGIDAEIDALAPWFHNLHLPDGTQTAPGHPFGDFPAFKWREIAPHVPRDLSGWRVLDVGCNAGFYSFELARRGAEVTAIDVDPHYLRQARWAAEKLGLADRVAFRRMAVHELARDDETYDLVGLEGEVKPQQQLKLVIRRKNGEIKETSVLLRIDTPIEVDYYKHGGILPFVLRQLLAA